RRRRRRRPARRSAPRSFAGGLSQASLDSLAAMRGRLRSLGAALALALARTATGSDAPPTPVLDAPSAPEPLAVHCGKLFDGVAERPRTDVWVTIRDGRIAGLGAEPRGDLARLDLGRSTCLPGLLDLHTHLSDQPEDTKDLKVFFTRTPEEALRLGEANA